MPSKSDIGWFKTTFYHDIAAVLAGTPFDPDMLIAIACQETGSLWGPMRAKGLAKDQIVRLCCGDTLDADKGRRAFPRNKADLIAQPRGQEMFGIARAALLAMAEHVPGYGFAKTQPNKFCHGYGVFQYDLQFFKTDPDYFLQRRYEVFSETLGRAVHELTSALKKRGLDGRASITDLEFCTVAIAYNTGGFKPTKGLKQGHFDGTRFYGENIADFLATSRSLPVPAGAPGVPPPAPQPSPQPAPADRGTATVTPPIAASATGPMMRVDTLTTSLRLRSEPRISDPIGANVIAEMPDGWPVRAFSGQEVDGFIEIETTIGGSLFRGFASTKFLAPATTAPETAPPPDVAPAPLPDVGPPGLLVPAVFMPRGAGTATVRTEPAGAHSLNEPGMPGRHADTPEGLRAELAAIIAYLNPEAPAHRRYQPRAGLTFCNIYAHDFCMLAGCYLPRVWWTPRAIVALSQGQTVLPLYENTITEMRANDLFRWLTDHGQSFGWRRATSADELQMNANRGAVCLIIARRKEDGRSGHVVMVVPETVFLSARRGPDGKVTAPLQSQAGTVNFNYGTGRSNWWKDDRFAESAMWMHA